MTKIYIKGPTIGSNLGVYTATLDGATTDKCDVPSFLNPTGPAPLGLLPMLSDGFDGDVITTDVSGLTGVTAYEYREVVSGNIVGTGTTLDSTGLGGTQIEVEVSADGGPYVSPPIMVYEKNHTMHHEMSDRQIIALVPHNEMTHIAVADGNLSSPLTWQAGVVPTQAAKILIPNGRVVTMDINQPGLKFSKIRVDGQMLAPLTKSVSFGVETIIVSRGGRMEWGSPAARIPSEYTFEVVLSTGDALASGNTDIVYADDPGLWSRGIISQGEWVAWGAKRTPKVDIDPIAVSATGCTTRTPTDWVAGDRIVIGGTKVTMGEGNSTLIREEEERQIDTINGNDITWTTATQFPHENQLVGSTRRDDMPPTVILRGGRNISIRSEDPSAEVWQRPHTAQAHGYGFSDLWDVELLNLGRTDKSNNAGEIDPMTGLLEIYDSSLLEYVFIQPDAQSNIKARYSIHAHHSVSGSVFNGCYVEDAPGWGFVHHTGDVNFTNCVAYLFRGAGFVAENGDETGPWIGSVAMGATVDTGLPGANGKNLTLNLKNQEIGRFDPYRNGYGFVMSGRAVRTNDNIAISCHTGHGWFNRVKADPATGIENLDRDRVDLKEAGRVYSGSIDNWVLAEFPIIHATQDRTWACVFGNFVTKTIGIQHHDVNVRFRRFQHWGCRNAGANFEYVGNYLIEDFDVVMGSADVGSCYILGANTYQVGLVGSRAEGGEVGVSFRGSTSVLYHDPVTHLSDSPSENPDAYNSHNLMTSASGDPRWYDVGTEFAGVPLLREWTVPAPSGPGTSIGGGTVTSGPDVTWTVDDPTGTLIDYQLDPSQTWALQLASWTGVSNTLSNGVDNDDGAKVDQISANGKWMYKPWNDATWDRENGFRLNTWVGSEGYWQYPTAEDDVLVVPMIISDRLSARPYKMTKMFEVTGGVTNDEDKGAFTYSANPVTVTDLAVVCPVDGEIVIDALDGAGGGDGSNYEIDAGDFLNADMGKAVIDYATGLITYTADKGYTGTDQITIFVLSAGQYGTRRIEIVVGTGATVSAPVENTNFTAVGGAGLITVTRLTPPDTGDRFIRVTQYSTDNWVTERKLGNMWIQDTKTITLGSDGNALPVGSVDFSMRVLVNHDYSVGPSSAPVSVTVS